LEVGKVEMLLPGTFPAFHLPTLSGCFFSSMRPHAPLPYILEPYVSRKSRITCPACGTPQEFKRYVNATTGELLPEAYGRCNREVKCGYHLSPYARPAGGGPSYAYVMEHGNGIIASKPTVLHPAIPPAPILTIPDEVYRASLGHYNHNALAHLLRKQFGWTVAEDLMSRFCLGTSTYWPGACVFWLIDEMNRVRGGQVVLYDGTGHTVKHPRRHTTWAHTALEQACQKRGAPLPAWLCEYGKNGAKSPCLYGLSQLKAEPTQKPIALVESAKTAILATPYLPMYVWLATMGLSYLTAERLEPLRGRRIILFPDAGAFDQWNRKANALRDKGFDVSVSDGLEKLATPAERQAGLDLADVILREAQAQGVSRDDLKNLTSHSAHSSSLGS
jgi:hypothetical protein